LIDWIDAGLNKKYAKISCFASPGDTCKTIVGGLNWAIADPLVVQ